MVRAYEKSANSILSKEFKVSHFDCKCERRECVETLVDDILVDGLTQLALVFPLIVINSGFRCAAHNKEIGGEPNSFHLEGKAADIHTPFAYPAKVAKEAEAIKCFEHGGIGIYNSWVHLDVRGFKARWDKTFHFGG